MSYEPMKWFGYLHDTGVVDVQRVLTDGTMAIIAAMPTVLELTRSFHATSRDDALEVATQRLKP